MGKAVSGPAATSSLLQLSVTLSYRHILSIASLMQWVSYLYVVKFYPCASLNHNLLRGDSSDVKVKSNFLQTGRNASELNSHCKTGNTGMPRDIALLSWISRR